MKFYTKLSIIILFSVTTYAQKNISQEEIRKKQEDAKKANDELQLLYSTNFSIQKPIIYTPDYNDDIAIKYDITISQFIDFHEFLDSRKAELLPFLYKNYVESNDLNIPHKENTSMRGYPYYGKLTIRLTDSNNNEFDSYGYIYDAEKTFDGVDDYKYREFKATVNPTSTTNNYEIYCDGKKITSKKFTTAQRNITSFESKMDGMSLLGSILQTFAVAYLENQEVNSFEDELYKIAQQKTCFYQEDLSKKTNSLAYLKEAQNEISKLNYRGAVRKLDASIWAENNFEALELRSEIFIRFNAIGDALKDYLSAIQLAKKNQNKTKLAFFYRKIAILLASLKQATDVKMADTKILTLFPVNAIDYLQKAIENGDEISKKLISEINSNDIIDKIKNLE